MTETILLCIASYNTLSLGKHVLIRTLTSIVNAVLYLKKSNPETKVIISWVDDASTDNTVNCLEKFIEGQESYIKNCFNITKLATNRGQAYCRNFSTALFDSDYIAIFDSDDEMLENHLSICLQAIKSQNPEGKSYAAASTLVKVDEALNIHPDWLPIISNTIPNTKIVRRDVWEFLEGFSTQGLYKKTGAEDTDFLQALTHFFYLAGANVQTVYYHCYKDNALDKQLLKFQMDPKDYFSKEDTFDTHPELTKIREELHYNNIVYLENKLVALDFLSKFNHVMTKYNF